MLYLDSLLQWWLKCLHRIPSIAYLFRSAVVCTVSVQLRLTCERVSRIHWRCILPLEPATDTIGLVKKKRFLVAVLKQAVKKVRNCKINWLFILTNVSTGLRFTICQNWLLTSAGRPQMECVSFSHLRTAFGQTNIVLEGFPVWSKAGFSVLTDGINKHPTWNYIEYTSKFLLSQTFPGILLFFSCFLRVSGK